MATALVYDIVDEVFVARQRDDLAEGQIDELLSAASRDGPKKVLVWVDQGSIRSTERKKVAEALADRRLRQVVVVTDQRLARGAATAVRWFGVPLSAFSTDQQEQALDELGLRGRARDRVVAALEALARRSGRRTG